MIFSLRGEATFVVTLVLAGEEVTVVTTLALAGEEATFVTMLVLFGQGIFMAGLVIGKDVILGDFGGNPGNEGID